ncbi:lantibiotic immunity ABC transporter MutG family permease subunit [Bacillus licheniformis]|nr:lantibiotic immunity ABC transporter MutG family permease subunit [Bacillus licheniformis]
MCRTCQAPFFRGWGMAGSRKCHTLFHILLISCTFGMGASILAGGAGLLMTALMNTGLGDVIWKYNPWAWGIRLTGYKGIDRFVQIDPSLRSVLDGEIKQGAFIMVFAIIAVFALSIIWFIRWEGRKALNNEKGWSASGEIWQ